MKWPLVRCKNCPRRISLPYDPSDPDVTRFSHEGINLVCRFCKQVCAYQQADFKLEDRSASPLGWPLVMLYLEVGCRGRDCGAMVKVNVVVPRWDGTKEYKALVSRIFDETKSWRAPNIKCAAGHILDLGTPPRELLVNVDW